MGLFSGLLNAISGSGAKSIPDNAIFVDVRSPGEVAGGGIQGALNIPLGEIERKSSKLLPDKNKPIVVFCASGMRSASARRSLISLGYKEVFNGGGVSSLALRAGKSIV